MIQRVLTRLCGAALCVLVAMGIAGCQGMQSAAATATLVVPPSPTPSNEQTNIQSEVDDVKISMNVPKGWHSQQARYGVLLVEKTEYVHPNSKLSGMQVYVFVRSVEDFQSAEATNSNVAWNILNHIVSKPNYIGDAVVTGPTGFEWKEHDGAYYLLNDAHSNLSLVMALVLPDGKQLVAVNVSCPQERAKDIRLTLPELLMGLTLNDIAIDPSLVAALPDPLVFPVYNRLEENGGK